MQPPCIGHIYFPSWEKLFSQLEKKDFPRHKKSLRPEAIGETVALPDRLLSSCRRWQKYEENLKPPKKKREIFIPRSFFYLYTIFLYYFHHLFLLDDSDISSFLIEFFNLFHLGRTCSLTFNYDISLSRDR